MLKKRFGLTAILLVIVLCLAGCGRSTTYTLFAYAMEGYIQEAIVTSSSVTLRPNGTGSITIDDSKGSISEWTLYGDKLTIVSGGDTITGTLQDGIMVLDIGEGWYYAAKDADTSSVPVLSQVEYYSALMEGD